MQQIVCLKSLRTLFCCSFVVKQVTRHKLAARGVILEAGDKLMPLGVCWLKEAPSVTWLT